MKLPLSVPRPVLLALCTTAALADPSHLAGQVVPMDEATYRLTVDGEIVGEERITVHRLGLGDDARILGQSEIRLRDGTEMRPRLEATPALRATAYQNRTAGPEGGEVFITRVGRRLVARSRTTAGESQREYRASDRTVILEPRVVLLYYFLRPWMEESSVELSVLDPGAAVEHPTVLQVVGDEEVQVGRRVLSGRHLRLEGDGRSAEVWMDDEGRVLRVELPESGFVAERLPD